MKEVSFKVATSTSRRRATGQPASKRIVLYDAIRDFCIECMGGDEGHLIRQEIGGCTCKKCPLYKTRPYQHLERSGD